MNRRAPSGFGRSWVRPVSDRAVFSSASAWDRAVFSAFSSRPTWICSVRKKPSTAIIVAEITSVVPTTRSCRLRCQRCFALAMTECSQRRMVRIRIVSRCGSQLTTQRTHFLRRSAISHGSRMSRCAAAVAAARGAPPGAAASWEVSPGTVALGWAAARGAAGGAVPRTVVAWADAGAAGGDTGAAGGDADTTEGAATAGGATGVPTASGLTGDRSIPGSARSRLVSHAADRDHDLRMLRIPLDLGPEPLYVHVHQPGVRRVPVTPDLLEQHLTGEHLPWLAGERDQQVELQRRKAERLAVPLDRMAGHVDRHVPDLQHLRRRLIRPAQPGPDPGDEFLGFERLEDVVVRPGLKPQDHVHGVGLRRQHDDRHARLAPDLTTHIDPVRTGQHQVEQHQIGPGLTEDLKCLVPVGYERRLEPLAAEHDAEHLRERRVVIDD